MADRSGGIVSARFVQVGAIALYLDTVGSADRSGVVKLPTVPACSFPAVWCQFGAVGLFRIVSGIIPAVCFRRFDTVPIYQALRIVSGIICGLFRTDTV